jgi:hypothetical protein
MRKGEYPPDELCGAQREDEPVPCQNPRNTCTAHCNGDPSDGGRCASCVPRAPTLEDESASKAITAGGFQGLWIPH